MLRFLLFLSHLNWNIIYIFFFIRDLELINNSTAIHIAHRVACDYTSHIATSNITTNQQQHWQSSLANAVLMAFNNLLFCADFRRKISGLHATKSWNPGSGGFTILLQKRPWTAMQCGRRYYPLQMPSYCQRFIECILSSFWLLSLDTPPAFNSFHQLKPKPTTQIFKRLKIAYLSKHQIWVEYQPIFLMRL